MKEEISGCFWLRSCLTQCQKRKLQKYFFAFLYFSSLLICLNKATGKYAELGHLTLNREGKESRLKVMGKTFMLIYLEGREN